MIPMSNNTRAITRVGYKDMDSLRQEKWLLKNVILTAALYGRYILKKKTPPSGWLGQVKMLGEVPPLPVKMRLNLEESLGEMF